MSWDALGGDPVPGDPQAVRLTARSLGEVAQVATAVGRQLRSLDTDGIWSGQAADAFAARVADLVPGLDKLARSHGAAQDALAGYAAGLEQAQTLARVAGGQATTALADVEAATRVARQAEDEAAARHSEARAAIVQADRARAGAALALFDPAQQAAYQREEQLAQARRAHAAAQAGAAAQRRDAARATVSAAQATLDAARRLADDASALRDSASQVTVARLHEASDAGIHNRGVLQKAFDDVTAGSRYLFSWQGFRNWLAVVSDVGNILATVGGLLCFVFPEAGAILLAVGAGLLAVALVGMLFARLFHAANNWDVARSMLDLGLAALPGHGALKVIAKGGGERTLTEFGSLVKRALAPADNRTLHGWQRDLLWMTVHAAPKLTEQQLSRLPVRILGPAGYFTGRAAGLLLETAEDGCKIWHGDEGQRLVRDLTEYHVPTPEKSRQDFWDDVPLGLGRFFQ